MAGGKRRLGLPLQRGSNDPVASPLIVFPSWLTQLVCLPDFDGSRKMTHVSGI